MGGLDDSDGVPFGECGVVDAGRGLRRKFDKAACLRRMGLSEDMAEAGSLSDGEVRFCAAMVETGLDRMAAYRRAFPAQGRKLSPGTVSQRAFHILQKEGARRLLRMMVERGISQTVDNLDAKLLLVYMERAFYDAGDFFDADGGARPLDEIPAEKRVVIDGVERRCYGKDGDVVVTVYKLASRTEALRALAALAARLRPGAGGDIRVTDVSGGGGEEDLAARYAGMSDGDLRAELLRLEAD